MLRIPSPNTDRSLLTIDELRAAAGVADSSRDIELQVLGDATAALITSACQVRKVGAIPPTLRQEAVVETWYQIPYEHRGGAALYPSLTGGAALYPSRTPIVSIQSVTIGGAAIASSGYEIDGQAIYRLSGNFRIGWSNAPVVVAYTAGYAVVPADLKWAARKFVQAAMLDDGRDPLLKRKVTVGVSEYEWWVDPTKDSVVPGEVMDILVRGGYANRWGYFR